MTRYFPRYNVYRKDRSARGGGVAILVKPEIEATIAADVGILECLCVHAVVLLGT